MKRQDPYCAATPVPLGQVIDGPPICLEFALRYPRGRYGGPLPVILRVPAPPGARGAARWIADHFERHLRRRPELALRKPRRACRICSIMLAAAAVAGPAGYALAAALPDGQDPLVPPTLLIGAAILAVFAAILALATFLPARSNAARYDIEL